MPPAGAIALMSEPHHRLTANHRLTAHCGRNNHFRQIDFGVPNFNFKYIYIKCKELRDNCRIFWIMQKTGKQWKLRKWRDQMHHFFIILQVTTSIAIVYRPQQNSTLIILNARETDDTFIILHNFIWQHFWRCACMMGCNDLYYQCIY